jgi:hypothetical protein
LGKPEEIHGQIPEPFPRYPVGYRAAQLADGSVGTAFLELFGRPPRDTCYEEERTSETSMWQAVYMINSEQLDGKLANSPRIKRLLDSGKSDSEVIDEIYLVALSRLPNEQEKQKLTAYLSKDKQARAQGVRDMVWAVLNTKEFLFIRCPVEWRRGRHAAGSMGVRGRCNSRALVNRELSSAA